MKTFLNNMCRRKIPLFFNNNISQNNKKDMMGQQWKLEG